MYDRTNGTYIKLLVTRASPPNDILVSTDEGDVLPQDCGGEHITHLLVHLFHPFLRIKCVANRSNEWDPWPQIWSVGGRGAAIRSFRLIQPYEDAE